MAPTVQARQVQSVFDIKVECYPPVAAHTAAAPRRILMPQSKTECPHDRPVIEAAPAASTLDTLFDAQVAGAHTSAVTYFNVGWQAVAVGGSVLLLLAVVMCLRRSKQRSDSSGHFQPLAQNEVATATTAPALCD